MTTQYQQGELDACLCHDLPGLRALAGKIHRRIEQGKPADRMQQRYRDELARSCAAVAKRQALVPTLVFPEQLPVAERRQEISEAIKQHQVVVIAGETGSGKTTQLPKICLELGRGSRGLIGHTQPRRIAARTVASRIAEELQTPIGRQVGYQVRFNEQLGDDTLVKLMTDGVLLAEIQSDPLLLKYDALIIDEAHERSLNIDFLLGYLKQLLPRRPDLKLIITSATIDLAKFSAHFDDAPVIEVSGRTYPVEVNHVPPASSEQGTPEQIVEVMRDILTLPKRGDILVFLSGEREIRETAKAIRDARLPHLSVLPLYARLSLAEQNKVFQPHKGVRVVLATNVAETSLTVPGIRYVIDPGTARISRYSYRSKVQRLPVEAISQASANQRKGRCGRVSDGICYRLYSEEDFNNRSAYTDPEIVRTNLGAVILQMLRLRIGDIRNFPFVDPPDQRLINDGFNLLKELGAVKDNETLTASGRQLAQIPVDPRLAAMLLAAAGQGALREVLVIVAVLSIQDPRERPADKRQAADEKQAQWRDRESDFVSLLNMWNHFEEQRQLLSRNRFDKYCRKQFVSPLRMREWRDMHHQLHGFCRQLKLQENSQPAGYDAVHKALLAGLLSHIGNLQEAREYLGARNRKFHIFPGSGLSKKPPKWLVASELIETSRLFAHTNARIDPQWIPSLARHLVKKSYSEPHYSARSGQVMAFEKQTLFGLAVVEKRRCSYGKINPSLSWEIFIRGALVEGGYRGKSKFFRHNCRQVEALEIMEAKTRRRDILVDDQVLFDFYAERVPQTIVNLAGFEHWRKETEKTQPKLLYIDRQRLINNTAGLADEARFPDCIHWEGIDYQLSYCFQPGTDQDGVTVIVPLSILHQVPMHRFEWLVPGLLREKCIALVKGLPKTQRRRFVPVPDYVDKALQAMRPDNLPLVEQLAHQLKRHTGVALDKAVWQEAQLDSYYRVNYRLVDESGETVAASRNLAELKDKYRAEFQEAVKAEQSNGNAPVITGWDFEGLPESDVIERNGLRIKTYPALVFSYGTVTRSLLDNQAAAENNSRRALVQLFQNAHGQPARYLRKQVLKGRELPLAAAGLAERKLLVEDVVNASYANALLADRPLPRNREAFDRYLAEGRGEIVSIANELERQIVTWLDSLQAVRRQMQKRQSSYLAAMSDVHLQLDSLFADGFLLATPLTWIGQYHRYCRAIQVRLERLPAQESRDAAVLEEFNAAREQLSIWQADWMDTAVDVRTEITKYRFMVEEYRVSLFAQQLKTLLPVSAPRLQKQRLLVEKMLGCQ